MSEEMTTTNWPNPDRTGYYWLKCRTEAQSELEIFYWDKDAEVFSGIGDVGCVDEVCFADHWEYHGPVLTPTQINEMLAAERERIKSMVARACNLGNIITASQRDMIIAGIDSETAIRNLGAASCG